MSPRKKTGSPRTCAGRSRIGEMVQPRGRPWRSRLSASCASWGELVMGRVGACVRGRGDVCASHGYQSPLPVTPLKHHEVELGWKKGKTSVRREDEDDGSCSNSGNGKSRLRGKMLALILT